MNIPNILTVMRFIIIPVFGFYLHNEQYYISIFLFTLGGITDILDGYIARKYNLITSFGKLADPLADKLMQLTALVLLTIQNLIPVVFLIIIVAKEVFMIMGSISLYKKENLVVSANWYGKLATVIFYFVIVMIFILEGFEVPNSSIFIDVGTGIAVLFTLFAFFMYSVEYKKIKNTSNE